MAASDLKLRWQAPQLSCSSTAAVLRCCLASLREGCLGDKGPGRKGGRPGAWTVCKLDGSLGGAEDPRDAEESCELSLGVSFDLAAVVSELVELDLKFKRGKGRLDSDTQPQVEVSVN